MGVQEERQLWGAETVKAVENFPISGEPIAAEVIHWLGRIKAASARVNGELGLLDANVAERIAAAGDSPAAQLRALVDFHVDFALDNPALITVHDRDLATLSEPDARRVRQLQRRWRSAPPPQRPALPGQWPCSLFFNPLGMIVTCALFLAATLFLLNRGRTITNVAVSLGFPVLLYLLFQTLLNAGLPDGILPRF